MLPMSNILKVSTLHLCSMHLESLNIQMCVSKASMLRALKTVSIHSVSWTWVMCQKNQDWKLLLCQHIGRPPVYEEGIKLAIRPRPDTSRRVDMTKTKGEYAIIRII